MPAGSPMSRPQSSELPHPALRWNDWNLLLLVPLVALATPLYSSEEPLLFDFPWDTELGAQR